MATTLVVRFPLGRYHATPWGRHVNEGQVELPPSPWRLLRAFYAVWKTRAPDLDEPTVHTLLGKLAEPPCYFVPPYRLSHTRHYYPDTKHRTGAKPSVDLTLDAFAVLDRDAELAIRWPFDLLEDQHKTLRRLAESLPYLGRADSLCEARVDDHWQDTPAHTISGPLDICETIPTNTETTTLLTPTLPLDLAALTQRPIDIRAGKLLFPRSTQFVAYTQPPQHTPSPAPRRTKPQPKPQVIRYTVTSRVLPADTDTVAVTDRLRNATVKRLNEVRGDQHHDSQLAGRTADGSVREGHQHAHYLALRDQQRRIAELAIWVPGGLDDDELAAATRLTTLYGNEHQPGPGTLHLRLAAYGDTATILGTLRGPARHWRSVTPFVPPRHPKQDWDTFLQNEIRRELQYRDLPEPAAIRQLTDNQQRDWRAFFRYRPSRRFAKNDNRAATRPSPPGAFLEITFPEVVPGPIALGHLSHFGLGLFQPIPAPPRTGQTPRA